MLGDRIRELRNKKDITLKELGNILKVGESTVSMYETNKRSPDYETLKKIADYFSVSTDYLLCRVDDPDVKIVSKEELPAELSKYVDYIEILKDYSIEDISPEELREVIEFAKRIKKRD